MLRSQYPAPDVEQLTLNLLRLRVLSLATEGESKIVNRNQCVWMLRSQHPSLHVTVEQLALNTMVMNERS